MNKQQTCQNIILFTAKVVVIFFILQALVILLHEFTHSTMAWLLGTGHHPQDIVWGNPITMTGWDEGVHYKRLFAQGRNLTAAIIGVSPLVMHFTMVTCGLVYLGRKKATAKKTLFLTVYLFVLVNLMELVAYIYMRSFAQHGDTGIFTRGTGTPPWLFFLVGSALLTWALWILFTRAMPRLQKLFFPDNAYGQWIILLLTSFIVFLWGSGIRVLAYVEDSSRLFGVLGIILFAVTLTWFRPGRLSQA